VPKGTEVAFGRKVGVDRIRAHLWKLSVTSRLVSSRFIRLLVGSGAKCTRPWERQWFYVARRTTHTFITFSKQNSFLSVACAVGGCEAANWSLRPESRINFPPPPATWYQYLLTSIYILLRVNNVRFISYRKYILSSIPTVVERVSVYSAVMLEYVEFIAVAKLTDVVSRLEAAFKPHVPFPGSERTGDITPHFRLNSVQIEQVRIAHSETGTTSYPVTGYQARFDGNL
jgi:hypothetical protein